MGCEWKKYLISKLVDNELSGKKAEKIRSHIEKCPECESFLVSLQSLNNGLDAVPRLDLSEDFDAVFYDKLENALERKRSNVFGHVADRLLMAFGSLFPFRAPVFLRPAVAVVFSLMLLFTGIFLTATDSPSVNEVRGQAFIRKRGQDIWQEMLSTTVIARGDVIKTDISSTADLSLDSKYHIRLRPGSVIRVAKLSPRNRPGIASLYLKEGDLLADIQPGFTGSKFYVETRSARVRSVGTKFMVSAEKEDGKTEISVVEGIVEVEPKITHRKDLPEEQKISVGSGMRAKVYPGRPLSDPLPLLMEEWEQLTELYMIGRKTRVALLISTDKNRVLELLSPCPIFISDVKPRAIPRTLEEAVYYIYRASEKDDKGLHYKGISKLEHIVDYDPDAEYNVQLLLFIGAYYFYLEDHHRSISSFARVLEDHPESPLNSLAKGAIAYIEGNFRDNKDLAQDLYRSIIELYPHSPEATFARDKIL